MKLILNVSEQQIKDLQNASLGTNKSYEDILFGIFYENLHNPVERLTEIMEDGYEKDLDKFSQLLDWYLLESIKDLKDVSKTSESYDTDYVMIKIMDKIRSDYLHNVKMMTSLYDEFRKHYKDEI